MSADKLMAQMTPQYDADLSPHGICQAAARLTDGKAVIAKRVRFLEDTYIYTSDGQTEYLIPYSSRPDLSQFENGVLYKAEEIFNAKKDKNKNRIDLTGRYDFLLL